MIRLSRNLCSAMENIARKIGTTGVSADLLTIAREQAARCLDMARESNCTSKVADMQRQAREWEDFARTLRTQLLSREIPDLKPGPWRWSR